MIRIPPITHGGKEFTKTINDLYREGQTDYSFEPMVRVNAHGEPTGSIRDGDAVIFCCRRGEREVELTEAFVDRDFPHFERRFLENLRFVILTLYHEKFHALPVAFAPHEIRDTLGETVSKAGLKQLRVAESEKYAHVTFFFNGGNHQPFTGEDDIRVPSPKGIPFDQIPELSLEEVAAQVVNGIEQGYPLIVTNFANGDVIGHTANREAKIRCAAFLDEQLGQVVDAAIAGGYVVLITADHGNLEELTTADGKPHVSHTSNPVQLVFIDPAEKTTVDLQDGSLADLAPTILSAMQIDPPAAMTGKCLLPDYDWGGARKVLLIILDGWGIGTKDANNPIWLADTPVWDELTRRYPTSRLRASGEAVGLQAGKAGNSEAGHLNIGAGRVVLQDDVRLDSALTDGSFFTNKVFLETMEDVRNRGTSLHLIGLLTEKSSHGSIDYPLALLKMAKQAGLEKVFLHLIFDGRSTEPGSAPGLLAKLEFQMEEIGIGQIATGVGRGIALDRDGNYAKIKRTYEAMILGTGRCVGDC